MVLVRTKTEKLGFAVVSRESRPTAQLCECIRGFLCHADSVVSQSLETEVDIRIYALQILISVSSTYLATKEYQTRGWTEFAIQVWMFSWWQSWRVANWGLVLVGCKFEDTIPEMAEIVDYWNAFQNWAVMVSGRRLVLTRSGCFAWMMDYGYGRWSQHAGVGDLFCVVLGCSTLLLIRPCGGYYQALGEGYVQGLMKGEALG